MKGTCCMASVKTLRVSLAFIYSENTSNKKCMILGTHSRSSCRLNKNALSKVRLSFMTCTGKQKQQRKPILIFPFHVIRIIYRPIPMSTIVDTKRATLNSKKTKNELRKGLDKCAGRRLNTITCIQMINDTSAKRSPLN